MDADEKGAQAVTTRRVRKEFLVGRWNDAGRGVRLVCRAAAIQGGVDSGCAGGGVGGRGDPGHHRSWGDQGEGVAGDGKARGDGRATGARVVRGGAAGSALLRVPQGALGGRSRGGGGVSEGG